MPAMHLMSVDLPAPLSPTSAMTSPGRDLEVDIGQRLHRAERLREVADLEEWCVAHECGGPSRQRWRRASAPPSRGAIRLLAVLLVLPGADLAPLQEPVPEEPGVVRLGDRDHRDDVRGCSLAVRPRRVRRRLLALVQRDRGRDGSVRLGRHVLVDRVGLPAGDDVLDALDGRVLPRERDGLEPLRLQRRDDGAGDVVVRRRRRPGCCCSSGRASARRSSARSSSPTRARTSPGPS